MNVGGFLSGRGIIERRSKLKNIVSGQAFEKESVKAVAEIITVAAVCFFSGAACLSSGALPFGTVLMACLMKRRSLNVYFAPMILAGMMTNFSGVFYPWGDFIASVLCMAIFLAVDKKDFNISVRTAVCVGAVISCNIGYYLVSDSMYRFNPETLLIETVAIVIFIRVFGRFFSRLGEGRLTQKDDESDILVVSLAVSVMFCGSIGILIRWWNEELIIKTMMFGAMMLWLLLCGYFRGFRESTVSAVSICGTFLACGVIGSGALPIALTGAVVAGICSGFSRANTGIYFCAVVVAMITLVGGNTGSLNSGAAMITVIIASTVFIGMPKNFALKVKERLQDKTEDITDIEISRKHISYGETIYSEEKQKENCLIPLLEERKQELEQLASIYRSQPEDRAMMTHNFTGICELMANLEEQARTGGEKEETSDRYSLEIGNSSYSGSYEISGDSFVVKKLSGGRTLMIISDGMGKGKEAAEESRLAAETLTKLIDIGFSVVSAIKTMNSILLTGNDKERFTTADVVIFNGKTGKLQVYKAGASVTIIKRGYRDFVFRVQEAFLGKKELIKNLEPEVIKATALPMGIVENIQIGYTETKLRKGDQILMVSDGVVDAAGTDEAWLCKAYMQIVSDSPQTVADLIMNKAIENYGIRERDDLTVISAKVI